MACTSRIKQTREIALFEGRDGQSRKTVLAIILQLGPFQIMEEEGLVVPVVHLRDVNRPAQRVAEIVLLERLALHTGGVTVEAVRPQRIVLPVIISRAVEFIRPRLGGEVGNRGLTAGVLRAD